MPHTERDMHTHTRIRTLPGWEVGAKMFVLCTLYSLATNTFDLLCWLGITASYFRIDLFLNHIYHSTATNMHHIIKVIKR